MKRSTGFTLTREQIEAIATAHGFSVAGPDHPVYKEPAVVVMESKTIARQEVSKGSVEAATPSVRVKPLLFSVIEGGTILNRSRSKDAQEEAMRYFDEFPVDILDQVGVEVIEGESPGSTFYAARLKRGVDVAKANRAAKKLNQPFRFKTKRRS